MDGDQLLDDYKKKQKNFHRELMDLCRRYVKDLDVVCIIGTLELAKKEVIELVDAANIDKGMDSSNSFDIEKM